MIDRCGLVRCVLIGLLLGVSAQAAEKKPLEPKPKSVANPSNAGTVTKPGTTADVGKKETTDSNKAATEKAKAAVAELTKAFRDFAKKPSGSKLSSKAEYFSAAQDEPTVDALWNTMQRPVSSDPLLDAYVRWQLTSGLPEKVDASHGRYLLGALQTAPLPYRRFGTDPQERRQFESRLHGIKQEQEGEVKDELGRLRATVDLANDIVIGLRDALLTRLPRSYEAFSMVLGEARVRVDVGVPVGGLMKNFADSVHDWVALDSPNPGQLEAVGDMLGKAKDYQGKVDVLREVVWNDKELAMKLKVEKEGLDKKRLETAIKEIKQAIANPDQNQFKFKDNGAASKKK